MFCSKCGQQIPDNSTFCSVCGAQLGGADMSANLQNQFQAQKTAVRQSEIGSLRDAISYFSAKQDLFELYDDATLLVEYYGRGAKSSLIVWGAIITTLSLVILTGGSEAFLGFLLFFIPGLAMVFGGIMMKVKNRKNFAYYSAEYDRIADELYDYYLAYPNCPVGAEYCNPEILRNILSVLESGRADTIKESINLLIKQADDEEYAAYLSAIEANSHAAAVFAAANLFK